MVEKYEGKTKAIKLDELKYTLLNEENSVRFDARISFVLTIEEMESTTLMKLMERLDATVMEVVKESEVVKSKRPMKRTIIID